MICPLLAIASCGANPVGDPQCLKEKCAWWVKYMDKFDGKPVDKGRCSIKLLAETEVI